MHWRLREITMLKLNACKRMNSSNALNALEVNGDVSCGCLGSMGSSEVSVVLVVHGCLGCLGVLCLLSLGA